jgi:phenylalanyl-tRNA synthetase beta chain
MKLSLSWLREWIDVDATPEQIADALTRRGFYVEGIEAHGHAYPGVVVARLLEVNRHPNADRLSLCRVDSGSGELSVVCGAPNVTAGMIVPLATVGAKLPGGLVIKRSKIRGEESQGMLCSPRELALSDEHEGILDLAVFFANRDGLTPGRPLDELMEPADTVFEVEIPFNRPDGLGVVGLAREVKAALGGRWSSNGLARLAARWATGEGFDLELEDGEGCPRYLAQVIDGITIAPSPRWLQRRLEAVGQRPINNVVDLTNFILFELGQPLHAFDLDRLKGPAIRVRRARPGEKLTTLDGRERELNGEVLVIADRDRPVAIAGVMGSANSEVHAGTTRLLLECAWFEPRRVRRGSRALGLSTEASKRYERGVDPDIGAVAVARFLTLLREIAPGIEAGGAREVNVGPARSPAITLRASRAERLIGMPIPSPEMTAHLTALEFGVTPGEPLVVAVPSWRADVAIEDDLVEEVARSHGYDRIPEAPLETHGVHALRSDRERGVARARSAMLARGLTEAWTTTLVSTAEALETARLLDPEAPEPVRLTNPMSRESEALRPNPLAGLLRACAYNLRQGTRAVRLFEIGAGFRARPGEAVPEETAYLAAIVTGPRWRHAHDDTQQPIDFADAKGLWEAWFEEMRVDTLEWRAYSAPGWKPGASAEVGTATSRIGWVGTPSPSLLRAWDIEVPVHLFVVLLDPLLRQVSARSGVSLPGRFPSVRRDLAFFVPLGVTHAQLERTLAAAAGERLTSIELFDVYAGPGTPQAMKSLAFALEFQHPDRTLTESEVQTIQDQMVAAVARECGGLLREK